MGDLVPPAKKRRRLPSEPLALVGQSALTSKKDGGDDVQIELPELNSNQRVSAYVQVFEEILSAVLEHESFLFTSKEIAALQRWKTLHCTLIKSPLSAVPAIIRSPAPL
jgi:hypothetical protein